MDFSSIIIFFLRSKRRRPSLRSQNIFFLFFRWEDKISPSLWTQKNNEKKNIQKLDLKKWKFLISGNITFSYYQIIHLIVFILRFNISSFKNLPIYFFQKKNKKIFEKIKSERNYLDYELLLGFLRFFKCFF